jgi:hypothetical protein
MVEIFEIDNGKLLKLRRSSSIRKLEKVELYLPTTRTMI